MRHKIAKAAHSDLILRGSNHLFRDDFRRHDVKRAKQFLVVFRVGAFDLGLRCYALLLFRVLNEIQFQGLVIDKTFFKLDSRLILHRTVGQVIKYTFNSEF